MADPSTVEAYGKPVLTALAGIAALIGAAWKLKPSLRQMKRDDRLAQAYASMEKAHSEVTARYYSLVSYYVGVESDMREMSKCVAAMATTLETICEMIPVLVVDNPHSAALLRLVEERRSEAQFARVEAEKIVDRADDKLALIHERVRTHQIAPMDLGGGK